MAYKHNCKPHDYVSLFHNLHDINQFALFDMHVVLHDHEPRPAGPRGSSLGMSGTFWRPLVASIWRAAFFTEHQLYTPVPGDLSMKDVKSARLLSSWNLCLNREMQRINKQKNKWLRYIRTHTRIHTNTHAYIHTYAHTYIHTYLLHSLKETSRLCMEWSSRMIRQTSWGSISLEERLRVAWKMRCETLGTQGGRRADMEETGGREGPGLARPHTSCREHKL